MTDAEIEATAAEYVGPTQEQLVSLTQTYAQLFAQMRAIDHWFLRHDFHIGETVHSEHADDEYVSVTLLDSNGDTAYERVEPIVSI